MYQHRQINKTKEVMPKIFFAQTCFSFLPKKPLGKDFVEKIPPASTENVNVYRQYLNVYFLRMCNM